MSELKGRVPPGLRSEERAASERRRVKRDGEAGGAPEVSGRQSMTSTHNAVITGASRGLGLALAHGLAAEGWSLVIDARDGDGLRRAAASLPTGTTVTALPGDIADPGHRDALRRAADDLGGPDLLINNAGTLAPTPLPALAHYPIDQLRPPFELNALAPLPPTHRLLPTLP